MSGLTVTINGTPLELTATTTVAQIVAERATSPKGLAVAVNDEVVPRSRWSSTALADGDRIELLTAAQGG